MLVRRYLDAWRGGVFAAPNAADRHFAPYSTKTSSSCEKRDLMMATAVVDGPTYRLIPSRYPPISAFESVASEDDLEAVMELEGWTNDRLVLERVHA